MIKFLSVKNLHIKSIFQYTSNKKQLYTVYLYLETALRVLRGTSTHHQERIQMYLQHLGLVTRLLLPAAIAAGNSNLMMGGGTTRNMYSSFQI
jgi:hypothetical protein